MTLISKTSIGLVFALSLSACQAGGEVSIKSGGDIKGDLPGEEKEEAPTEDDKDVSLEGDEIKIKKKIRFATGSAEILEESNGLVKAIAKVIKQGGLKKVEVIGHTDTVGSDEANQKLSEDRAKSVVAALQARNVKAELVAIGKGESKTMCQEETEECHAKNRRVQFKVIE